MLTLRYPVRSLVFCATIALVIGMAGPAIAQTDRTVRLVQHPDGTLEVQRGAAFSAAPGTRVVVEETDVTLRPAVSPAADLLDATTGLAADAMRAEQWNLDMVSAEQAWSATTGEGQMVAVIDTGVDTRHEDLDDRVLPGWSPTEIGGTAASRDDAGHGTHVAGIIAAVAGNQHGVAGLAPAATVLPVQVMGVDGAVYASDVAAGLIWAADQGVTVANLSLAGTQRSRVLDAAIDYAVAADVVVVVAAGNEYAAGNPTTYPASHPDVIAVAALRDASTRSAFSTTGDFVDLAAPGSSVLSTRPGSTYGYASGTSMAAPLVAAAATLLRSIDPDLTGPQVVELLTGSARDLGRQGVDEEFGHGAVDVLAALAAAGHDTTEDASADEPVDEADPVDAESAPARDPWSRQTLLDRDMMVTRFTRR